MTIDDAQRRGARGVDRLPGRLDDGARLRRRVRRRVNAWYVWIPLCVLFVAPFLRPARRAARALLHLDLLVLLGFSVSLAFFNHARIDLSVPLVYPLLVYLLVRMLLRRAPRRRRGAPSRCGCSCRSRGWRVALVFLVGFRVGLNVTNSNVIDVGYSGVIGADRLVHGKPLYGELAEGRRSTATPTARSTTTPTCRSSVWPWSGSWDDLPAAHAAAVVFDLLTIAGLFLLGRRIRGPVARRSCSPTPGPPTRSRCYALDDEHQRRARRAAARRRAARRRRAPAARGACAGARRADEVRAARARAAVRAHAARRARARPAAGAACRSSPTRSRSRSTAARRDAAGAASDGDLHTFWDRTIAFQRDRESPFSVWGL